MAELTIDQALQQGVEAHKAGRVQEADRLYTAILKAQPKHPDTNHNMGVLAVGVGKVQEGLPFFKTALETNPNTAQFWLSYIDALIKLERLADAKSVLDQAKEKGAKGDGFDKLEQRLKETGQEASKIAAEPQPKRPNILDSLKLDQAIKRAKKKAKEGDLEEAKRIYHDILTKFPKNKRAADGLKGLSDAAVGKGSKTQDLPKHKVQALMNLYNQGQLAAAVKQAQALTEQYPHAFILWNILGAAAAQTGKLDQAIIAFEKVITIQPNNVDAYNNIGNAFQEQGKLEEAIETYNKALAIKPDYADAFNNMGNALKEQGKLEEAMEAYNKALYLKPDFADAFNNMGNALKEQGKLEEAIGAYKKALALKPDYAEAYSNMGNALRGQGKLEEAIKAYHKSLALKPNYAEAYYNMGNALLDQGNLEEAIEAYNKALAIKPDFADAYNNMGVALKGVTFTKPNACLWVVIKSLLDRKVYVRPGDISGAVISLLKFEPSVQNLVQKQSPDELEQSLLTIISHLSKVPLLLTLMSVCPLADLELEEGLTDLRSYLLLSVSQLTASLGVLRFQSALALQCFTNEYVYKQTDSETKALKALEDSAEKMLSNGEQPSPQTILCLASYKALHEYEWSDMLTFTNAIDEVFTRQVLEPEKEASLKPDIPALKEITNEVSSKVMEQYEVNPYPRWVNLGLALKPFPISKVVDEVKLKLFDYTINEVNTPNILIAGCGTGQHSIGAACRLKNSKVLAIDLSLSSLAYAKRKTDELGVTNIEYMQADILALGKLDKQFDIVESAGVLHHMDDPMAGWRVLTDCLKPGGLMKIGLYSELARQHIVKIREEINQSGIGSSDPEMKSFRHEVINSDKEHHKSILNASDFYSTSMLRDLLFHVQEHRFTIPQLRDCLHELGLKFCGFEAENVVQNFKLTNTGRDDPYDLDKWQTSEKSNPNTFVGMYQFWCQKVA